MTDDLPPFPDSGDLDVSSGENLCDFCSPPARAVWVYPCRDFQMPDFGGSKMFGRDISISAGAWAACETCAALIETGDSETLSRRTRMPDLLGDLQRSIVERFFRHRIGARYRDDRGPSVLYDSLRVEPTKE